MEEAIKITAEEQKEAPETTSVSSSDISEKEKQEIISPDSEKKNIKLDLFEEALEKNENYQSGFWNGYFELSKDNTEAYLSQKTTLHNIQEEIQFQEQNLKEIQEKINHSQKESNNLFSELTRINYQLDYEITLKKRREQDLAETTSQKEHYYKESQDLRNKNSFLGGILFLAAAVVFILGDLIISHEIVAYALNIKNSVEAWAFAVGLAMVSVLLKPAYDRLIEYPYSQDSTLHSKRVYLIFKILIVAFTLFTLGILGYFRYEAYRADQLKNNINSNILALQEDESLENLKLIESLSKKSEDLSQNLVNSDSGMWAFVLSGVMFAIAGAICLGIAFPILVAYVRIWFQIPQKTKRLEKKQLEQRAIVEEIEKRISEQTAIAEAQKNKLHTLGNTETLLNDKKTIEKRILELKQKAHKTENEIKISEVTMGYEKGRKAFEIEKEKQEMQKYEAILAEKSINANTEKAKNNGYATMKTEEKPLNISEETPEIVVQENPDGEEEIKENVTNSENNSSNSQKIPSNILNKIKKK